MTKNEPPPERASIENGSAYDRIFALTYLANSALMVAVAILFRYADFVTVTGGSSLDLGLIAGIGTIGAIAMRVFQGVGIDRFGPRRVWLLSLFLYVLSLLGHLLIIDVHGPAVYAMRILMTVSLAGAFGASITFVSLRVPDRRMAEMIGMLGSSGFVGIALGPTLGDWIMGTGEVTRTHVDRLFYLAAACGGVSLLCAFLATHGSVRRPLRRQPHPWPLIKKYHPGMLLLIAAAMGVGIGFPMVFLRKYGSDLGIPGIRYYFIVYAAVAFTMRVSTRRLPERIGPRPMILTGLACLSVSMLLYLLVVDQWTLMIPAVAAGCAHAFLFPSVTSAGATTFPVRYRGLATTLILAFFDVGTLFGQPMIGGILEYSPTIGLAPYPTLYITMCVGLVSVGVTYMIVGHRRRKETLDTSLLTPLVKIRQTERADKVDEPAVQRPKAC